MPPCWGCGSSATTWNCRHRSAGSWTGPELRPPSRGRERSALPTRCRGPDGPTPQAAALQRRRQVRGRPVRSPGAMTTAVTATGQVYGRVERYGACRSVDTQYGRRSCPAARSKDCSTTIGPVPACRITRAGLCGRRLRVPDLLQTLQTPLGVSQDPDGNFQHRSHRQSCIRGTFAPCSVWAPIRWRHLDTRRTTALEMVHGEHRHGRVLERAPRRCLGDRGRALRLCSRSLRPSPAHGRRPQVGRAGPGRRVRQRCHQPGGGPRRRAPRTGDRPRPLGAHAGGGPAASRGTGARRLLSSRATPRPPPSTNRSTLSSAALA